MPTGADVELTLHLLGDLPEPARFGDDNENYSANEQCGRLYEAVEDDQPHPEGQLDAARELPAEPGNQLFHRLSAAIVRCVSPDVLHQLSDIYDTAPMRDARRQDDDDPTDAAAPVLDRLIPFLPPGSNLFTQLDARAVVLNALPEAIGSGIILAENSTCTGLVAVREGQISRTLCIEHSLVIPDIDVFARIASWNNAVVSASHLATDDLELVEQQLAADVCYADLRMEWTDSTLLLSDLRSRPGRYLVVLHAQSGSCAIAIAGAADGRTYARPSSTGVAALGLEELLKERAGVITVYRMSGDSDASRLRRGARSGDDASLPSDPQPAFPRDGRYGDQQPAARRQSGSALAQIFGVPNSATPTEMVPHHADSSAPNPSDISLLLPDLKLLVRSRLRLSSGRIEALLDEAVTAGRPVESAASAIRNLSVRGVMQSTLDQLADDIVAMSLSRARAETLRTTDRH